jgi:hypothetical protein
MPYKKMLLLASLVTLTTACGGALPEDTQQLPVPEQSSGRPSSDLLDVVASMPKPRGPEVTAQVCFSDCDSEYFACAQVCNEMYPPPYEIDGGYQYCMQDCYVPYDYCRRSAIVYKAPGNTICHLDIDRYLFGGIDFEFYTVDHYGEADSCGGTSGTWYKKRRVAKVECSYWTAMTDESECTRRIKAKFQELMNQGYYPTFDPETQSDQDFCPYPRL